MKNIKTLLSISAAAAAMTLSAAPAVAEVEASIAIANAYLFRGIDQGGGGQVSGDITYSNAGFYATAWMSSTGAGEEVDLIAGYGMDLGGVTIDLGFIDYYYPEIAAIDSLGDLVEGYIGLGAGGAEFYFYTSLEEPSGTAEYNYFTLSYGMAKWSALLGFLDSDEASGQSFDDDYFHLDISYAVTDNLSITYSQLMSVDDETDKDDTSFVGGSGITGAGYDNDAHLIISYSIPLK